MAATTQYHKLSNLNDITLFSHGPAGWKFKIKVLAGLVSGKTLYHVLKWPFLCVFTFLESLLLIRTLTLLDQGPTLMISFNCNYLIKVPISTHSHIGSQGSNLCILGDTIQPIIFTNSSTGLYIQFVFFFIMFNYTFQNNLNVYKNGSRSSFKYITHTKNAMDRGEIQLLKITLNIR